MTHLTEEMTVIIIARTYNNKNKKKKKNNNNNNNNNNSNNNNKNNNNIEIIMTKNIRCSKSVLLKLKHLILNTKSMLIPNKKNCSLSKYEKCSTFFEEFLTSFLFFL